jgi:hypothetical protein
MTEPKTKPTNTSVADFLASIPQERRRADGERLLRIFHEETGAEAVMWGPSIIGYGTYRYKGKSTEGDWFRVGFSPRSSSLVLYGLIFYDANEPNNQLLTRLGAHKRGKGCLYVKKLADIDEAVLRQMIHNAFFDAAGSEA